jgi:hypothetical protein
MKNIMTTNAYRFKRNYAIGSRSTLVNSLDTFNYTYYEIEYDSTTYGIPSGDMNPYTAMLLVMDPETVFVTRTNMVVVTALSSTGGMSGIIVIIFKFISSYVSKKQVYLKAANSSYKTFKMG